MQVMVMLMAAVLALAGRSQPQQGASASLCRVVSFDVELDAGKSFTQKVGDLVFKIRATNDKGNCNGWRFSLEDASMQDFIYPANMPLRFNPSQFLACSYGLNARQGLEMKRSLRFILNEQDYLRLDPLMRNALWPADSPDPEHAAEKYLQAIRTIQTGLIRLKTIHYELSCDGFIGSATFTVELIAPDSFHFEPSLRAHSMPCPPDPSP